MDAKNSVMQVKSGIRRKLVTVMLLLVLSVLVLLTYWQISSQKTLLHAELQKQTDLMLENLHNRALFQANQLLRQAEEEIASFNLFELSSSLQAATNSGSELEFVILVNKNQQIVIHTQDPTRQQTTYSDLDYPNSPIIRTDDHSSIASAIHLSDSTNAASATKKPLRLIYKLPIHVGSGQWGQIILGYSLAKLNAEVHSSEQENTAIIKLHTARSLLASSTILVLTYLVISRLALRLSAPIVRLTEFAQQLSKGDFSNSEEEVKPDTEDEVGVLTAQFSEMAVNLKNAYHRLEEYNISLEHKVQERTQQLNVRNEELIKAINDLEDSQQQLVHAEKMAALGQLVASIAHEVNTPLGAIQASAGNATKFYSAFANSFELLFTLEHASDEKLFHWLLRNAKPMESLTTREERTAKRNAVRLLEANQIERAPDIADMLVDMGLAEQADQLLPILQGPKHFAVIESAYHLTGIMRSNQTIYSATARASKIVFALKSFARQDQFGEKVETDINASINTVLVLYNGLLKQGCQVVKHYSDLPLLNCHADELNQVWTNLIHNALQAMDYKGTLTLETKVASEAEVWVSVSDTGQGIEPEIQHRIWESFFTTKVSGEGSGLGLGICKRIVEKHSGRIFFDSKPGSTTFTVALPILEPKHPEQEAAPAADVFSG
jgi:signal transduction histidine kinase